MPAGAVCCTDGYCDAGETCLANGKCGTGGSTGPGTCDADEKTCEVNFCIPATGTCCYDGAGGWCKSGFYCDEFDGCCPDGKTCDGSWSLTTSATRTKTTAIPTTSTEDETTTTTEETTTTSEDEFPTPTPTPSPSDETTATSDETTTSPTSRSRTTSARTTTTVTSPPAPGAVPPRAWLEGKIALGALVTLLMAVAPFLL
jgi:hypothetical protein